MAGNAPVIIKRKKVIAGGGHHGGAWKVAYADFVTAMMAFFMLMWLLNATTEQQRKGLADYFSPSIPLARISGGGDGIFQGDTIASDGAVIQPDDMTTPARVGPVADGGLNGIATSADPAEVAALQDMQDRLLGVGGESLLSDQALRHVVTRLSDEGLTIEVFARDGAPLFEGDTDTPTPVMAEITAALARVSEMVRNPVAISAATRSRPVILRDDPVWPLTLSWAARVRDMLVGGGMGADRFRRVTGMGDAKPVAPLPAAPRNDRIEVTFLRISGAG